MGDENPIRTLGDSSKPSHEGYRNTIELLLRNNVVLFDPTPFARNWLECLPAGSITTWKDLTTRFLAQFFPPGRTAKLRNDILIFQQHQGESLSKLWTQDLALYDNEIGNDPNDFAKPVKAISLLQDVPSTSDRRLIELENQVQRLMEAHLALTQPTQVNKITTSCEICNGPHDTQYCMEDPEQAFVEYASLRTKKAGEGLISNFMASQDARLSKFEADFKQQQREMANKIDTVLKAITNRMAGALPSDTVKNPKLNVNTTTSVLSARPYPTVDLQCSSHLSTSINAIKTCSKEANISHTSKLQPGIRSETQQIEEPEPNLEDEFQDLHLKLPVLKMEDPGLFTLPCRLADETKSYHVGVVKDVEVHIGKLKLLNDFYVIDMKKDLVTPLLVGRGFLVTANAVIDHKMSKIVVGERIIRKDFLNCHFPEECEIARDAEINPCKDVLVFRRMVEFLGAIPIKLKSNMWESEDLINNPINWNKPPKNGDGAWHAKIRLIDPDGKEFTKTLQSILTTRKLSERESTREIIDLDHFYDT
ncbi:MAK10-like protein [Tanacetum coccineum]